MASLPRVSDNPEVQSHYALQVGLTAALVQALRKLRALVEPKNPAYKVAIAALVEQYSQASASFGADFYDAMRVQAGVTTPFRTPLIDPPPAAQVQASLSWATADPASSATQSKVEGAAQKLVADTGRNELIAAIEADTEARGFARVTRPGACYFCRALATRGAVYADEMSAGRTANARFTGDGEAKFHDNCHCAIEPLFGKHYEPPAHTRADMALWKKSTKGESDKLNAFRRAVEAQRRTP